MRKAFLFFTLLFSFTSCLKNQDDFAKGPKAEMIFFNYVVNNAAFDVSFDNSSLTTVPLSFGMGTGSPAAFYTRVAAGTHTIRLSAGTNVVIDNILSLTADRKYSFFVYDTLKSGGTKSLLLQDVIVPLDTMAKGRFLQFIPGSDTLTITITRNGSPAAGDTLVANDTYIGHKSVTGTSVNFSLLLRPGDYKIQLARKDTVIFQHASLAVVAGKVYSFIAQGVKNGTGTYEQRIAVLQHN